jgi:hypothetical protein
MKAETGHIIGATYMSKYWRQEYQVMCIADSLGKSDGVKVLWEDGRTTTHCTHVGQDPIIKEPQYLT